MNADRAVWALAVVLVVTFFYALAVTIEATTDTSAAPASTQRKADCPRCNP